MYGCCHWRLIHNPWWTNELNANGFLDNSITGLKYIMPLVLMNWCTSNFKIRRDSRVRERKKKTLLGRFSLPKNDKGSNFRFQQCYNIPNDIFFFLLRSYIVIRAISFLWLLNNNITFVIQKLQFVILLVIGKI